MTLLAIKLAIGSFLAFVQKHWRAGLIVLTVIALFVGVAMLKGCGTEHEINKTANTVTDQKLDEANKDAVSKVANVAVEQTTTNSHTASIEREKANKRDSNEYKNTNAGERFCERFPKDSSCQ